MQDVYIIVSTLCMRAQLQTLQMLFSGYYHILTSLWTYCVEAAFVDFIQNHDTVLRQAGVGQDLSEQAAVCHVLHHRVLHHTHTTTSTRSQELHIPTSMFPAVFLSPVSLTCVVQSSKRT